MHKAEWHGQIVAVKVWHAGVSLTAQMLRRADKRHRAELMREIHFFSRLNNANIVAFRGACSSGMLLIVFIFKRLHFFSCVYKVYGIYTVNMTI